MFNVAILTPSTGICQMGYAQSMARMVMYFAQVRIFEDEPKQCLNTDSVIGSGIAQNYESMVLKYLEDKTVHWTHFLSVEDDMGFQPDVLHIMARRRVPIVGANYSTNKGRHQRFTAAKRDGPCITTEESTGIEEVTALPQGLTLVAREVYEALPHPWFLMGYSPESGRYVLQDYYFSSKAIEAGFKLYVDHDVSKKIVHTGPYNYTYKDVNVEEQYGNVA